MVKRFMTDRQGHIGIKESSRKQRGTAVWVECQLGSLVQEFLSYAEVLEKAKPDQILLNGKLASQGKYEPPTNALSSVREMVLDNAVQAMGR